MKKLKRMFALFLALVIGFTPISIAADPDISGYDTILWADVVSNPPAELEEGQVWTGKSLYYHHRGADPIPEARVTVSLHAWGNTFWGETVDAPSLEEFALSLAPYLFEQMPPTGIDQVPPVAPPDEEDEDGDDEEEVLDEEDETPADDNEISPDENETSQNEEEILHTETSADEGQALTAEDEVQLEVLGFMPFAAVEYMPLDSENPYLVITDNTGEFKLDDATFVFTIGGVDHPVVEGTHTFSNGALTGDIIIAVSGTYITWSVHQHLLVGPTPVTLSYDIYLDEPVYRTGLAYSSGTASSVRYYPNPLNHNYWYIDTTIMEAFSADLNWNNGWGMRSGTITDNEFGVLINLGENRNTPVGQLATDPGADWRGRATITRLGTTQVIGVFDWHLQWYDYMPSTPKFHYITIRDFPEAGLNTTYQLIIFTPGGNDYQPGGRTITATESIRRTFPPGNPAAPFMWDGNAIVTNMDAIAQVLLEEAPEKTGTVIVQKELAAAGPFEIYPDWGVDGNTVFTVIMRDTVSGMYLMFSQPLVQPDENYNTYNFLAFVTEQENATRIRITENKPAMLNGVPVDAFEAPGTSARYIVTELYMPVTDLINTTYSFDDIGHFGVEDEETTTVTVINTYSHGIGTLTIAKMLDGFYSDWGINLDTVFYMRVWDVSAGNWLLFKEAPEADGTFWCVGNHWWGLTEPYDGPVMLEIPVTARTPVVLSNLWSWGAYEVVEVRRRTGDGSVSYISSTSDIRMAWNDWWAGIDRDHDMNHRPWLELPPVGIPDVGGPMGGFARWEAYWEVVPSMTASDEDWADWDSQDEISWRVQYSADNGLVELMPFGNIVVGVTNRYKYEAGNMFIHKVFDPGSHLRCWGVDNSTVFQAIVWDDPSGSGEEGNRNRLIFQEIRDGSPYPAAYRNIGFIPHGSATPVFYEERDEDITNFVRTVQFSVNRPAKIIGLPITNTAEERFHNYIVQEYFSGYSGHIVTHVTFMDDIVERPMPEYGIPADSGQAILVNVHNFYPHGSSMVVVNKILDGSPSDWNIDGDTEFFIRVVGYDTLLEEYLGDPSNFGLLEFIDNSDGTFSWDDPEYPPYNPNELDPITFLPFSRNNPLYLLGLDSTVRLAVTDFEEFFEISAAEFNAETDIMEHGRAFRKIEDYFPASFFSHTIKDDPVNRQVFHEGHIGGIEDPGNLVIDVHNEWDHGIATLIVYKELVNEPAAITGDTKFPVIIRDATDSNNLLWIPMSIRDSSYTLADNVWWCVGNDVASLSEFLTPAEVLSVTPIIPISVNNPATLLNLWTGREYRVYEFNINYSLRPDYFPPPIVYRYEDYTTAITNYGGLIWHGETKHATVINTFVVDYYTVTYHGNGNDSGTAPVDSNIYHAGDEVTILGAGDLEKDYHAFIGWSRYPAYGVIYPPNHIFNMPSRNVNLYARWERTHFTVTYHGNGHDGGTAPVDSNMYQGGEVVQVMDYNDLYKTGHAFWGWSEDPEQDPEGDGILQPYDPDFPVFFAAGGLLGGLGESSDDFGIQALDLDISPGFGLFNMPARDVDLHAIWVPGGIVWTYEVTVTYYWGYDWDEDGDDEDIYYAETYDWDHETDPDGLYIVPPADPTRPNYNFMGWYWYFFGEPQFEWDFDDPITFDIDFIALWEPIEDLTDPTIPTLAKAADRTIAEVGDIIIYTLTVTNHNEASLSDFVVVDTINTALVSFNVDNVLINGAAVVDPDSATFHFGVLRVNLAELPPSGDTVITFPVTVLPGAAGVTVTNTAILEGPPNGSGNERDIIGDPTETVHVDVVDDIDDIPVEIPTYEEPGPGTLPGIPPIRTTPVPAPGFSVPFSQRHYQYLIGYDTGEIRPHGSITRAEVATIFFRLITDDFRAQMWMQTNPYSDVSLQQWFNNAISTMTNARIFYGMPDGSFQPDRPITRAEFAAAITRFLDAGHIEAYYGEPDVFTDIAGHWAQQQINVIGQLGWAVGTGNREFEPNRNITRAEVAILINRMLRRRLEFVSDTLTGMIIWPDNTDETTWYFLEIQEATNSNEYEMKADGIHKRWTALTPNRRWELLERPDSTPYSIRYAPR